MSAPPRQSDPNDGPAASASASVAGAPASSLPAGALYQRVTTWATVNSRISNRMAPVQAMKTTVHTM